MNIARKLSIVNANQPSDVCPSHSRGMQKMEIVQEVVIGLFERLSPLICGGTSVNWVLLASSVLKQTHSEQ